MRIMLALVSEQRMQNAIPIFQKDAHYDQMILVLSKARNSNEPQAKYRKSASDLEAMLKSHVSVQVSDDFVDPYDIEDVAQKIRLLIERNSGKAEIILNMSGGTKPMAVGALQAAQAAGIESLYTNTEDGEIIWLAPSGSVRSEIIRVPDIDVPLYIRAYGEEVLASVKASDLDEYQVAWATRIVEFHSVIYQTVIVPVTSAIKTAREKKKGYPITAPLTPTRRQRAIIKQLAQDELWEWNEGNQQIAVRNPSIADFLNGGWVEVMVANQLYTSSYFDDVRVNVKLLDVEGEIDVAAVSNARLVLVECKSNVQKSQQLSKLDSFRQRLGGPFAHAYYARASAAYAKQIREQARKYRIDAVYCGAELQNIGTLIAQRMGAIP